MLSSPTCPLTRAASLPPPFLFCAAQGAKEVEDKYGNAAEKMPEDVAQLAATERWVGRAGVREEWLLGGRKAELLGSQGRFGCRRRFGHWGCKERRQLVGRYKHRGRGVFWLQCGIGL